VALHPSGRPDRALARLIGPEDLWIGAIGSLFGIATAPRSRPASHQLILVALAAAAIGTLIAILAAIIPATMITRLPTFPLLASE
jgi:hypothetical protein